MFDVNTPDSMFALKKWWDEFCDRAPVADEDINDYCCVVVGNKIDTIVNGKGLDLVLKSDAFTFLDELDQLVPPSSIYPPPPLAEQDADLPVSKFLTSLTFYKPSSISNSSLTAQIQTHSDSIDIPHPFTVFLPLCQLSRAGVVLIRTSPSESLSFGQPKLNPRSSSSAKSGSAATLTPGIYTCENGSSLNTNITIK